MQPPFGDEAVTRTISARYHKDGAEVLIAQEPPRLPRRLTPLEVCRLQGFPRECERFFDGRETQPVSDTQAYRQFGNSVCCCTEAKGLKRMTTSGGPSQRPTWVLADGIVSLADADGSVVVPPAAIIYAAQFGSGLPGYTPTPTSLPPLLPPLPRRPLAPPYTLTRLSEVPDGYAEAWGLKNVFNEIVRQWIDEWRPNAPAKRK